MAILFTKNHRHLATFIGVICICNKGVVVWRHSVEKLVLLPMIRKCRRLIVVDSYCRVVEDVRTTQWLAVLLL